MAPILSYGARRAQRGVSLIVSLVFLMAMSLLGVAAVMSTTSEERMARVDRDHTIALQAAEAALRDAELDIKLSASATPYVSGTLTRSIGANTASVTNYSCGCGSGIDAAHYGLCLPATAPSCVTAAGTPNPWEVLTNWNSNASVPLHAYTTAAATASTPATTSLPLSTSAANGSSQQPRYMIEIFPNTDNAMCSAKINVPCNSFRYRITARGWGPSGNYATLQEAFQP